MNLTFYVDYATEIEFVTPQLKLEFTVILGAGAAIFETLNYGEQRIRFLWHSQCESEIALQNVKN